MVKGISSDSGVGAGIGALNGGGGGYGGKGGNGSAAKGSFATVP